MLTKRIIACLDVKDGRTVKGVRFGQLRDMGHPVALATHYAGMSADELVLLDISATNEQRRTFTSVVGEVARVLDIPFTVGGGISTVQDVATLLEHGADKVSLNTAALQQPALIADIARRFGSQCVVVAIDARYHQGQWWVYSHAGTKPTPLTALQWARQAESCGAGEILLTAINNDGTRRGFALDITGEIASQLRIPVIASGGAGNMQHFADVFLKANADAALAAGIFHQQQVDIPALKQFLSTQNIAVRL